MGGGASYPEFSGLVLRGRAGVNGDKRGNRSNLLLAVISIMTDLLCVRGRGRICNVGKPYIAMLVLPILQKKHNSTIVLVLVFLTMYSIIYLFFLEFIIP